MSNHDILTEEELAGFSLNQTIKQHLELFRQEFNLQSNEINVLDWGCGRGRSTVRLRELGYNAYGIDVDKTIMNNGRNLFYERGYDSYKIMLSMENIDYFEDNFFHAIISEQVLEHIEDVWQVAAAMWRLTKSGGVGIHLFPGSKNILEGHLFMPYVHWFPKTKMMKLFIIMLLLLGKGPTKGFEKAKNEKLFKKAEMYYQYISNKTFYRDCNKFREIFQAQGFHVDILLPRTIQLMGRTMPVNWFPKFLRDNGFPGSTIVLLTRKQFD